MPLKGNHSLHTQSFLEKFSLADILRYHSVTGVTARRNGHSLLQLKCVKYEIQDTPITDECRGLVFKVNSDFDWKDISDVKETLMPPEDFKLLAFPYQAMRELIISPKTKKLDYITINSETVAYKKRGSN